MLELPLMLNPDPEAEMAEMLRFEPPVFQGDQLHR